MYNELVAEIIDAMQKAEAFADMETKILPFTPDVQPYPYVTVKFVYDDPISRLGLGTVNYMHKPFVAVSVIHRTALIKDAIEFVNKWAEAIESFIANFASTDYGKATLVRAQVVAHPEDTSIQEIAVLASFNKSA
jgi:hypothetical protein